MHRLLFLILICLLLNGCATGRSNEQPTQVAMHIDALLEFAIEYPLAWRKQRLLYRAENRGEVRWTIPERDQVRFSVFSTPLQRAGADPQARLAEALRGLSGFEPASEQERDLPGGRALWVTGETPRLQYALLLFVSPRRAYTLSFSAPAEDFERFQDVLAEIAESFTPLIQPDANPRPDQ